jgi:hypothetical protein
MEQATGSLEQVRVTLGIITRPVMQPAIVIRGVKSFFDACIIKPGVSLRCNFCLEPFDLGPH